MENNNSEKDVMKESKGYTSLSARLPRIDASLYRLFCEKLGTNTSDRLRQLIMSDLKKPARFVLAGTNKIRYNKMSNSFSWLVQLDSGQETEVLKNISLEFLKNFQNEIQQAINERNEWTHHTKPNSIEISTELIGGEK